MTLLQSRPDPQVTMPAFYLHQIVDQAERLGASLPIDLRQRVLGERSEGDVAQTVRLSDFKELVKQAMERSGEQAFGLLVGQRLGPSSHGVLGFATLNSASMRQALDLLERYLPLRTSLLAARQRVVGSELHLGLDDGLPLGEIRVPVLDAVLLALKTLLDQLTLGAGPLKYVALPYPEPAHAGLARDLFRCELRYAQRWAGLAFDHDRVEHPLVLANPAMFQQARLLCERELALTARQTSWVAQVRRVLLESTRGFPSLNVTARLLKLTPRTLHRRLVEEGSSYRAVLDEVRHTLAVAHLQRDGLSIQEIAYQLGYDELANFRRAFKRWESVAPSAYRDGQRRSRPAPAGRRRATIKE